MVLRCSADLLSKDLQGHVYIVTGATSGLGRKTAEQLAKQGATVVIGCRNLAASQKVATELSCNVSGSVEAMKLDLYNPDSIRQFVDEFKQKHGKLKALINNAGVNFPNDTRHDPANDREVILHTNYVGPFLLTKLLLPTLEASAPSRIINLSSAAHEGFLVPSMPRMNFDDLEWRARKYNGVNAYSESKLMVTLHTEELARRYGDKNVVAVSVQPGFILSGSGLTRAFIGPVSKHMMVPISWCLGAVSVTDGIQTTLHCVLADNVVNGAYYAQSGGLRKGGGGWPSRSINPDVGDAGIAERLWEETERMLTGK